MLHVLVDLEFTGDPKNPPRLTLVYSNAPPTVEAAVRQYVAGYRMTCRKRNDPPSMTSQMFTFRAPDRAPAVPLKTSAVDVATFISAMEFDEADDTRFDFNAMSCPFSLRYTFLDKKKIIDVEAAVSDDLVRLRMPLIRWLHRHQMNYSSPRTANELVGQSIDIAVPCGQLHTGSLRKERPKATFPF